MSKGKGERTWSVRVRRRSGLIAGLAMILLSFFMPLLFTIRNFRVVHFWSEALETGERLELISAALGLVALNSVRALPHYCGAFLVADALEFRHKGKNAWYCNAALVLVLLFIIYRSIDLIYGVYYDFGLPAIAAASFIILFNRLDYNYVSVRKKTMLVAMELIAWQFLDVMPIASALPVGRGEVSQSIKQIGLVLEGEHALNIMGGIGILLFACAAFVLLMLLRDENYLREMEALKEQNDAIRDRAYINELHNRTYQEVQHLVHDLKAPLTVVETLVGACKLESEMEGHDEQVELMNRVENAVDQMSEMISEILYRDKTSVITVDKLLKRVLAQLSIEEYADSIHLAVACPEAQVRVNRILFTRVLVNLVQNAAHAAADRPLRIVLRASAGEDYVRFEVEDNGRGIAEQAAGKIWDRGYSGTGSSGLGLAFVRDVVTGMGASVEMRSKVGEGSTFAIRLTKEA